VSLYPETYWDLVDVVAVVSKEKKYISTTAGHAIASTSPFYAPRIAGMERKIGEFKRLLAACDFTAWGNLIEREALEMHAVMITSTPPLLYWLPTTVILMKEVQKWRSEGIEAYFTINTGQDVHVICREKDREKVVSLVSSLPYVQKTIPNKTGKGTRLTSRHLF
jgi:diphosphomevalonate decarboxylase